MTLQNYLLLMPFIVMALGGAVWLVSWAMTRDAREVSRPNFDDGGRGGRLDLGWGVAAMSTALHRYVVLAISRLR